MKWTTTTLTRAGGQVELGGLLDFEARHGRLGEGVGSVILQLHQCVRLDFRLSEHGFREMLGRAKACQAGQSEFRNFGVVDSPG